MLRAAAGTGKQVVLLSYLLQAKDLRQAKKVKGPGVCSPQHLQGIMSEEDVFPSLCAPNDRILTTNHQVLQRKEGRMLEKLP